MPLGIVVCWNSLSTASLRLLKEIQLQMFRCGIIVWNFHIWKVWGSGWGAKSQMVDLRPQGMDDMGGSKGF